MAYIKQHPDYWTTDAEKDFLGKLGEWRKDERCNLEEKIELMEKYIEAARHRVRWNSLDSGEVIRYAKQLLEEMEAKLEQKEKEG